MEQTVTNRVTGEQITFIETAKDTKGEYLLIEVALPPHGKGPPLHIHDRFEEEFEVISGKLTVTLGKINYILVAGERRVAPMKTPHTFTNNDDDPVVFRVRLTPPSQFEQSVRIHYGLMEDGLTDAKGNPKLLAHTALVLSLQNTLIAGIPLWIQRSIFGLIVKRAHKRGLYEALEKYTGETV
ncbi:quercetin dioxygenase-like cupin family protein [Paenibacillus sp. PastF-3]|uniref:cupin domain-containing protein n=1 Tax=Paenibacillus sp. PastF-3 TaxID=2940626 RepID=UPI002475F1E2|nr:cupin domain-containing protein [Paenibacillus sp. PastF-3]MDH6372186.1 quercetin dioxygenase-like cupin family protein [Paenibacillus sp. PastF-3]